jgi:hypothetical protein
MAITQDVVRRLTVVATERGLTSLKQNLRETDRAYDQVAASSTRAATATEAADRRMMALLRQRDRYMASLNAGGVGGVGRTAAGDAGMFAASRIVPFVAAAGAAVAAISAVNAVVERGTELLEKYGNAQRNLVSGVDESLKTLTRFQDNGLSADQVQRATQLGARLTEANREISEFFRVQFDVTNGALKLQAVWVAIVEVIAKALTSLNSFINSIPSIPGGFDNLLRVAGSLPGIGVPAQAALALRSGSSSSLPAVSAEEAMTAARARLAGGMGSQSNFAVRFGTAVNDLQNIPKAADDATKAVQETARAFDQYDNAVQRVRDQIAELELQSQWYGKNSEEVLKLKTAHDLLRAAKRAGREETPELLAEIDAEATRYAKLRAEVERVAEARRMVESFGSSIVSAFMSGGNAIEKMTGSLASLGQQLASKNLSNFLNGKGLFGNQQLGSVAGAAGMLGAGAMGYQSGSPLMGALGGAMAGASFGPMGMLAGAAIGGLGGLFGQNEQKKKAQADAAKAQMDALTAAQHEMFESAKRAREEQLRLAEAAVEAAAKVVANIRAIQDRAFAAGNDSSTLSGALAAFDRQAQRDREEAIKEGGHAIALLEATMAVERLQIQKRFNDEALSELKRSEEDKKRATESAARGIVDYVLGLRAGADSPLSGSARLTAAQSAYNSTLGLAQGGNTDALGRITQDAETLRLAAQDFYGSSASFQAIFNQISQQLLSLPAVQQTTDPVVASLANILSALGLLAKDANLTVQMQALFHELDTNGDGTLSKLELIRGTSAQSANLQGSTAQSSGITANVTESSADLMATSVSLESQMVASLNRLSQYMATSAQAAADAAAAQLAAQQAAAAQAAANLAAEIAANDAEYQTALQNYLFAVSMGWISGSTPPPTRSSFGVATGGRIVGPGGATDDRAGMFALSNGEGVLSSFAMRSLEVQRPGGFDALMHGRWPSNDNMVGELRAMHRTVGSLLSRIASLEEQGNAKIDRNTEATMEQTESLNSEQRINARKRVA